MNFALPHLRFSLYFRVYPIAFSCPFAYYFCLFLYSVVGTRQATYKPLVAHRRAVSPEAIYGGAAAKPGR